MVCVSVFSDVVIQRCRRNVLKLQFVYGMGFLTVGGPAGNLDVLAPLSLRQGESPWSLRLFMHLLFIFVVIMPHPRFPTACSTSERRSLPRGCPDLHSTFKHANMKNPVRPDPTCHSITSGALTLREHISVSMIWWCGTVHCPLSCTPVAGCRHLQMVWV
jgi:hypothetical protein